VNRTVARIDETGLHVNVNGENVLDWAGDVGEGRFAVGALSWGDPATVTFDNVLVTTPTVIPQAGTVLLAEGFDDPTRNVLGRSTPETEAQGFFRSGVDGEYSVRRVNPNSPFGNYAVRLPFSYSDASLAVDARLVPDAVNRYLYLSCRSTTTPPPTVTTSEYRFWVYPDQVSFSLSRLDAGTSASLVPRRSSTAIQRDTATNRLELECRGSSITARINGVDVATVQDSTYREGGILIGVGYTSDPPGRSVEARFDNLVVTQR
jgi:hypothetical protein